MLSIVVPCYNTDNTLKRTVESLMAQTTSMYQIILVDDGSTDNTAHECDSYASSDDRIKVIHQSNKGLMGAWKRGVSESDGDHIAFCDADDYIDNDFVERIYKIIEEYNSDMICFGMVSEYPNGDKIPLSNRLPEGFYNRTDMEECIFPRLFSDGSMQSELIIKSRWSKVFRKDLLESVMPMLNEEVSIGEDELTVFAFLQTANSVYCAGRYYPYHYVRATTSMIGQFDRRVFDKLDLLYNELVGVADKYSYSHKDQILYDRLSTYLLHVKKYVCKSIDGYRETTRVIKMVRESAGINECIEKCSTERYRGFSRIMAGLFVHKIYSAVYYLPRVFEHLRGRNV